MRYTELGNTGVTIPVIAQGTTGAGSKRIATAESIRQRIDVLRHGIDLGMTLLDTADDYEDGHAEELVGRAVRRVRNKVILCSKFAPKNNSREAIQSSIEASLKRLNTDYIDVYQVHWPNPEIPLSETMAGLETLVEQGKARFIGVCNFSVDEIREADAYLKGNVVVSAQAEFNICNMMIEQDLIPYCTESRKTVLAYSVFNQGRLSAGREHDTVRRVAADYNVTVHELILAWVLSKSRVVPIVNSMSRRHTEANAATTELDLEKEDVKLLDDLFRSEPVLVDPSQIEVLPNDVDDAHIVYTTLNEAIRNPSGLKPGPTDLAKDLSRGKVLKPVELVPAPNRSGKYQLVHGRVRYWAWIIAFGQQKPMPAFILDELAEEVPTT